MTNKSENLIQQTNPALETYPEARTNSTELFKTAMEFGEKADNAIATLDARARENVTDEVVDENNQRMLFPEYLLNSLVDTKDGVQAIVDGLKNRGSEVMKTSEQIRTDKIGYTEGALRNVGDIISLSGDLMGPTLVTILKLIPYSDDLGTSFLNTSLGKKGLEALASGVQTYDDFKKEYPRTGEDFEAVASIISLIPLTKVLGSTSNGPFNLAKSVAVENTTKKVIKKMAKTSQHIPGISYATVNKDTDDKN